jgi:hypothetical protein
MPCEQHLYLKKLGLTANGQSVDSPSYSQSRVWIPSSWERENKPSGVRSVVEDKKGAP